MLGLNGVIGILKHVMFVKTYSGDHATGSDAGGHASHPREVGILSRSHEELVPREARLVVYHEQAALHADGVAVVEHGKQLKAVAHALVIPTSKVSVLIEDDLKEKNEQIINDYSQERSFTIESCEGKSQTFPMMLSGSKTPFCTSSVTT